MLRRRERTARRAGDGGRGARAGVAVLVAAAACALAIPAQASTTFSIVGRGFGHGVGMSQYGAQGFALHGWDYRRILAHYYPGTRLARARDAHVRVLIQDGQASVALSARSPIRLVDAGKGTLLLPAGRYELRPDLVFGLGGTRYRLRSPVRFEATGATIELDGNPYRGTLVVGRGYGGLYVVDDVQVDDYVRGVVSWEMPSLWHQQALRVQAVAARSYALAERKPDRLFDLFQDTRSQMYGGVRAETAGTNEAVEATRGEAITWHGKPAIAFYSSDSGGCTAALADGMPGAQRLPYLQSVSDPYDSISPTHAWGPIAVSADRVSAAFGLPGVSSLRVVRNGSGRVAAVAVGYAGGVSEVSGSAFARAFGLRSTWFDVGVAPGSSAVRACSAHGHPAALPPRRPPIFHAHPRVSHVVRVSAPAAASAAQTQLVRPPVKLVVGFIVVLAALGVLGLALPDRRLLAVCMLVAVGGVCADRWVDWSRSTNGRVAARPVAPSRHDESPSASASPSSTPSSPSPSAPSPSPPAPTPPEVVTPQPAVPQAPPSGTPPPTVPEPSSPGAQSSPPAVKPRSEPSTPRPAGKPVPKPPKPPQTPGRGKPGPGRPVPPPVSPPPPPPSPPPLPPPPTEGLAISDVHVSSEPGARALRVAWRTNVAASTAGASAPRDQAIVWTPSDADATEHETVFSNLAPATPYTLSLHAVDQWGRQQTAELQVKTPPRAAAPTAQVSGQSFLVDGQPFFPVALWALCPGQVDTKLAQGVNLFMGNGCGSNRDLVTRIAGRALSVVDPETAAEGGGGVVGWHYPDEWDNGLPSDVTAATLQATAAPATPPLLSFLTLTNHFYSYAAPLPQGRGMYPVLAQAANVLGFDLYPLQVWCRADAFGHVYESQRELVQLAAGKPTYQWIEAAPMEHCPQPELAPTAQTVRAESWLAIAGGATAIGYFPNGWTEGIDQEITRTDREIQELAPALLAMPVTAQSDQPAIKVSARILNGAVYVIAVNSSNALVPAKIGLPELYDDKLDVYDEHRQVQAAGGAFTDVFEPLQVHVYIAAPQLGKTESAATTSFDRFEEPEPPTEPKPEPGFGPVLP